MLFAHSNFVAQNLHRMKNKQQEQAKELYFQSNLSKTEIAGKLNVNRRTIYMWAQEGNWDALRKSAQHMPSILAEKLYYVIGHLTDNILKRDCSQQTVTKAEVDMLSKLTNSVAKLRKGSTVSENMETFTHLLERIKRTDASLADQLVPHVAGYVEARRGLSESSFLLAGHNHNGSLPHFGDDILEKWADEEEAEAIRQEAQQQAVRNSADTTPAGNATTKQPSTWSSAPAPGIPLTPGEQERMDRDIERILGKSALQTIKDELAAHRYTEKAA